MKVMAFNGSPRKKTWNTVTLLENALKGASSAGAETELVHLYDLTFSGCISCFSCKKLSRKEDGVCAVQDDLSPVLDRIKETDALIIGTPLYYCAESASTRAFVERLCFPYIKFAKDTQSLFPRRINTAMIYTMNLTEKMIKPLGLDRLFGNMKYVLERHFGPCQLLLSTDTLMYSDYDDYESGLFAKEKKIKRHAEVFPVDCRQAFELGIRMASGVLPELEPMPRFD